MEDAPRSEGPNPTGTPTRFGPALRAAGAVAVALFVFWQVPQVFFLTFFAILIGVLLYSAARLVGRSGLGHGASLAVVGAAIAALAGGLGVLFGSTVASQIDTIAERVPATISSFESTLSDLPFGRELMRRVPLLEREPGDDGSGGTSPPEPAATDDMDASSALVGDDPAAQLVVVIRSVVTGFGHIVYVLLVGIFLAATPRLYRRGVRQLFPDRHRRRADDLLDRLYHTLRGFLLGQLGAMVFVGTGVAVGLAILGVPLALGLGFIAFLFEFIPTIGPWIAGIPAILIAFTQGPATALWVTGLFVALELIEGNLLLPVIYRRTVELPPALTLFAILLLGTLFGVVGVLVAAPLCAVALATAKEFLAARSEDANDGDEA